MTLQRDHPGSNLSIRRVRRSTLLVRRQHCSRVVWCSYLNLANATGIGWEAAFQQASDFVAQLTLQEKQELVTGETGPCVGMQRFALHYAISSDPPF